MRSLVLMLLLGCATATPRPAQSVRSLTDASPGDLTRCNAVRPAAGFNIVRDDVPIEMVVGLLTSVTCQRVVFDRSLRLRLRTTSLGAERFDRLVE